MSKQKRQDENLLLREKHHLIETGESRKDIKIRGNKRIVHNQKFGAVINNEFVSAKSDDLEAFQSITYCSCVLSVMSQLVSLSKTSLSCHKKSLIIPRKNLPQLS